MTPAEHLKTGDLDGALAALQAQVRADPADAKLRIFLFQLLCVSGDWKRAITQLKLCAELDAEALAMAQTYREAIICEVYREKVFAGEKEPLIFGDPEEWVALLIEAVKQLAAGRAEEAAKLRAQAFDAAPAVAGELNGETFEWIADADMRLGPMLEIIVNGKLFLDALRRHRLAALRAAGRPARRGLDRGASDPANGGEFVALIPTRYAGTEASGDGMAKLARRDELERRRRRDLRRHRPAGAGDRWRRHRADGPAQPGAGPGRGGGGRGWLTRPSPSGCSRRCSTG